MSNIGKPHLVITESSLKKYISQANALISRAECPLASSLAVEQEVDTDNAMVEFAEATGFDTDLIRSAPIPKRQKRLLEKIKWLSGGDALLSDAGHYVLRSIRTGIQISLYVTHLFEKEIGIDQVLDPGRFSETQKIAWYEKRKASVVVAISSMANYIAWSLRQYNCKTVDEVSLEHIRISDVSLEDPAQSLGCSVYYAVENLEHASIVSDASLVRALRDYYEGLFDDIALSQENLPSLTAFVDNSYQLEGTDFVINGLIRAHTEKVETAQVKDVKFEDIIGNDLGVLNIQRILRILFLYDITEQKNPFLVFGDFPSLAVGHGKAGTGKSLLIAAAVGKALEYAEMSGIPLHIHPLPRDLVDKFQGESGTKANEYMNGFHDASRITFGYADDAEHFFRDRGSDKASEGSIAVTNEFLTGTEGPHVVERGNYFLLKMTNYLSLFDPAVLNRVQWRIPINGAESELDHLRYDSLQWRGLLKEFPELMDLEAYTQYADYEVPERHFGQTDVINQEKPLSEAMASLFDEALQKYDLNTHAFYGHLFMLVQNRFEKFSLRDKRNIHKAVKMRISGFEIPEEFISDRSVYIDRTYEEKLGLLRELMMGYLREQKVSLAEVYRQEVIRYLDGYEAISENAWKQRIVDRVEELRIRAESLTTFKKNYPELANAGMYTL